MASPSPKSSAHVHKLIAKVAQEATEELYEAVMGNNLVRAEWQRQHPGANERDLLRAFVNANWAKAIPLARATLTRLLSTPIDEARKEEIMEALVLDASLLRGRAQPMEIKGSLSANGQ